MTLTALALLPALALTSGLRDIIRGVASYLGGWHWQALAAATIKAILVVAPVWLVGVAEHRHDAGGPHVVSWACGAFAAFVIQGPVLMALAAAEQSFDVPAEAKAPVVAALASVLCFWLDRRLTPRPPAGPGPPPLPTPEADARAPSRHEPRHPRPGAR